MTRALSLVPHLDDLFTGGLCAAGFELLPGLPAIVQANDVLVTWNRYARDAYASAAFERAGAKVIIAENGYIGSDRDGRQLYAMALGHHNGAGTWRMGQRARWKEQNIELRPWRDRGDEIVLLPQRGFGAPGVAMPEGWAQRTIDQLRRVTQRPVKIRPHPGKNSPVVTLEDDLSNAWAVVTWGSGAAIKALALGVPVFHLLPAWIGSPMARLGVETIETPWRGDRDPAFHRIGWAQWTVDEIRAGLPFRWLCRNTV